MGGNRSYANTSVVVADGYFMKKSFIEALIKERFTVVTKGRRDANLNYLYNGQQKGGKGRPKQFSSKVDLQNINKRIWKRCYRQPMAGLLIKCVNFF